MPTNTGGWCPEALTFPHPPSSPSPVSSLGHSPHGPDPSSAHWAGRHSEVSVPGQTKPCSTVPASGWGSWQVRRHPPKYPPLAPLPQVPHPRFLVLSLSSRPAAQTWTAGSGVVGCVRWSYLPSRPPLPRIAPEVMWVLKGVPRSPHVPGAASGGFPGHWLSLRVKAWAAGLWGLARGLGKGHSS